MQVVRQALDFLGIPEEIVHENILSFLSFDDVWSFKQVNKTTNKLACYHLNRMLPKFTFPKKSKITSLYKEQVSALIAMQKVHGNLYIRSPMGSGKTLMGLIQANYVWETQKKLTLIIVTAKCITSWIKHIKLCGWKLIKSKPLKSDVLVLHGNCKEHKEFFLSNVPSCDDKTAPKFFDTTVNKPRFVESSDFSLPSSWRHGIIITTPYYLTNVSNYSRRFATLARNRILD
jgi:hypothetical protein